MNSPPTQKTQEPFEGEELSIGEALDWLRKSYKTILAVTGIFLILGILKLHLTAPSYLVTYSLAPAVGEASGLSSILRNSGLSALGSGGGQASTASINLDIYKNNLTSNYTAEKLFTQHPDLVRKIYRGQWDEREKQWVNPRGGVPSVMNIFRTIVGIPVRRWHPPNSVLLSQYLKSAISVEESRLNNLIGLTMQARDPELASEILLTVSKIADDSVKDMTLARTSDNIAYIQKKLKDTAVEEYRQVLVEAMVQEVKLRMMAKATVPMTINPLEPPFWANHPNEPKGFRTMFLAVFLGLVVGFLYALFRTYRLTVLASEKSVSTK